MEKNMPFRVQVWALECSPVKPCFDASIGDLPLLKMSLIVSVRKLCFGMYFSGCLFICVNIKSNKWIFENFFYMCRAWPKEEEIEFREISK